MTPIDFNAMAPNPVSSTKRHRLMLMVKMLEEVADGTWTSPLVKQVSPLAPSIHFDLLTWAADDSDYAAELEMILEDSDNPDEEHYCRTALAKMQANKCGYAACAVGHATLDPRFNDLGLVMERDSPAYHTSNESGYGWIAVRKFFDIPQPTAEWLFMPDNYLFQERGDPLAVAARCRMVANGEITDNEISNKVMGFDFS